ncbi:MAG TPA: CPBP family intramembrane glutamic endopeptidase, partial [Candidatus Acidoferrum sp.]|nr:CPBP family intramembrane glutamic endopeptidase [Candidatus Acidoferrum sp.]
ETVVARRATWMGGLSQLPVEVILPLAAFAAIWEETVFRGFLLGRLRASIPAKNSQDVSLQRDVAAILLSAICFGLGHGYQGVLGMMQTTLAGIALGALAVWRKSLWPAIGTHLAIDVFGLIMIKVLKPMLDIVVSLMAVR